MLAHERGLGCSAFAHRYLRNLFDFFSSGYLDVSVPQVPPELSSVIRLAADGVIPFGNRRIKGFRHLPDDYRGHMRPSSVTHTKASPVCVL